VEYLTTTTTTTTNNKNYTQIDLDDSNNGGQSDHYDGDTKGTGVLGDRASWFRSSMVVVVAFTTTTKKQLERKANN